MPPKSSNLSSDAGFEAFCLPRVGAGLRPVSAYIPQVVAEILRRVASAQAPRRPQRRAGLPPDRQGASAPMEAVLTGRHRPPTGEPASTSVRVGGEGTTSREAFAIRAVSAARRA